MERHEFQAFQAEMKTAVLKGEVEPALVARLSSANGVAAEARLQIHHNNYRETLSDSLLNIFPALEAFVGTVFVKGALSEYCLAHPPEEAALSGYGSGFASFLAEHTASKQLPYVVDIVRLEWALHELQLVEETKYADPGVNQENWSLSSNARIINSEFPLMSLWSVAAGQIPPEAVHLEQGGQTVVALLRDGAIGLIALGPMEASIVTGMEIGKPLHGHGEDMASVQSLINKEILVPV